jgi:hypothetical protein
MAHQLHRPVVGKNLPLNFGIDMLLQLQLVRKIKLS